MCQNFTPKIKNIKDIKDDQNKWKGISCMWVESLNNVHVSIMCQLKYRLNVTQIPAVSLMEINRLMLNLYIIMKLNQLQLHITK